MPDLVTLTIDGCEVSVPGGTMVVDAAKKIGIDIPIFCYHPKMEPVGMCRMCLVEIGRPMVDRATGQVVKDENGNPKIQFGPKLETACTTPVSAGMVVNGASEKVREARKEVVEFLLTSHPLDCPICDKGGECPLQNLTMRFGPGQSRYLYDEKIHLAKHYPLGDLILLDRERCIQCGRCVRFQDEIADDPVIAFFQRGRSLEIITNSDPGFDSYFSGNTTDICPVGALTTSDFRFGARPWEMNTAASICPHCPVGCNLTFNVRREARAGGNTVIKRAMPRQNEQVNEIWICDKGRFGYHFTEPEVPGRLTQPLVRKDGELVPATWEEALEQVAEQMRFAGSKLVTLAGGRLANEDLFNLKQLTEAQGGKALLHSPIGGGDLVSRYGLPAGSNISDWGKGTAILVIACDLEEEAPVWWLRIKQAAGRGATLIVANPRNTKLDRAATYRLRYNYGEEVATLKSFMPDIRLASEELLAAAQAFASAENAVILYGAEGMDLVTSQALAQAAVDLLEATHHADGRANNGLIAAWPHGNTQGAWELGFRAVADLGSALAPAGVIYIAAADPAGENPGLAQALSQNATFVVVQDLWLSDTARLADVVLPALPFTSREGTFTNGERRVQRFYLAVPPRGQARADFTIAAQIALRLGLSLEGRSASLAFRQIAAQVPAFAGLSYERLAEVEAQWPLVGRQDVYYGGTTYDNQQGLGEKLAAPMQAEAPAVMTELVPTRLPLPSPEQGVLLAVPVMRLYDRGQTLAASDILHPRLTPASIILHPDEADLLGVAAGDRVQVRLDGTETRARVSLDGSLPHGVALVPRSTGLPVTAPALVRVRKMVS